MPTLLVGMSVALHLTLSQANYQIRQSYWVAVLLIGVEAPATFVLYRYLARLACEQAADAALAVRLRTMSWAATAIILLPLGYLAMAKPLYAMREHPLVVVTTATYGMLVLAASVLAWAWVAKLAWGLGRTALGMSKGRG